MRIECDDLAGGVDPLASATFLGKVPVLAEVPSTNRSARSFSCGADGASGGISQWGEWTGLDNASRRCGAAIDGIKTTHSSYHLRTPQITEGTCQTKSEIL